VINNHRIDKKNDIQKEYKMRSLFPITIFLPFFAVFLFCQSAKANPSFPISLQTPSLGVLQMPQTAVMPLTEGISPILISAGIISSLQIGITTLLTQKEMTLLQLVVVFSLGLASTIFGIVGLLVELPLAWAIASLLCLPLGLFTTILGGVRLFKKIASEKKTTPPTSTRLGKEKNFSDFVPTFQFSF
jgi:hypothetical protein